MQITMRYHHRDSLDNSWNTSIWWSHFSGLRRAMSELEYHRRNGRHAIIQKNAGI